FINVFSPCVTFNKVNTYDWFKQNLTKLDDLEDYDATDLDVAKRVVHEHNGLVMGLIYQDDSRPDYQSQIDGYAENGLTFADLEMNEETFGKLAAEFM
ncbi:2-oxoacid:ferredoxin oxidoreductase subunit beta, partial [Exiguobacterium artemiae]|nr:2-oxoacid:ferredoxin oxidoreductase subunit beta [Exiguobacterium artemiae]